MAAHSSSFLSITRNNSSCRPLPTSGNIICFPDQPGTDVNFVSSGLKSEDMSWRAENPLEAVLAASSCSPRHLRRPQPLSEFTAAASERKRSFYSCFDNTEDAFEDDAADDSPQSHGDKKARRLAFEQVKALEKAFELENRLEPERKVRLASQLGLQPRQVAVWFQNRRARWKTKQMERDYGVLKSKFETLKADRDELLLEKEKLQAEVSRLRSRVASEQPTEDAATDRNSPPPASCDVEDMPKDVPVAAATSPDREANSMDQKADDSFSRTDDSDDSAIVDSAGSSLQNESGELATAAPEGVVQEQNLVQAEASGTPDDAEFYQWRLASSQIIHRPIKDEWLDEDEAHAENHEPFLPLEWYWS